jgi:hypothetical protein
VEVPKDWNLIMLNPHALKEVLADIGIETEFFSLPNGDHQVWIKANNKIAKCSYFFVNEGPIKFEKVIKIIDDE